MAHQARSQLAVTQAAALRAAWSWEPLQMPPHPDRLGEYDGRFDDC
jgi:hypothetical protein